MEWDPIEFLAPERSLNPKLDHVRRVVSDLVGAKPNDLVFVRNATEGVNAVLRSMPLHAGDEISPDQWETLQRRLRTRHRIELPVFPGIVAGSWLLRIAMQAYNELEQVARLAEVLQDELPRGRSL